MTGDIITLKTNKKDLEFEFRCSPERPEKVIVLQNPPEIIINDGYLKGLKVKGLRKNLRMWLQSKDG